MIVTAQENLQVIAHILISDTDINIVSRMIHIAGVVSSHDGALAYPRTGEVSTTQRLSSVALEGSEVFSKQPARKPSKNPARKPSSKLKIQRCEKCKTQKKKCNCTARAASQAVIFFV